MGGRTGQIRRTRTCTHTSDRARCRCWLRDGDQERARRLSSRLGPGFTLFATLRCPTHVTLKSSLDISGGSRALARVVEIDPSISDSRFMTEYGRAILRRSNFGTESKRIFEGRTEALFRNASRSCVLRSPCRWRNGSRFRSDEPRRIGSSPERFSARSAGRSGDWATMFCSNWLSAQRTVNGSNSLPRSA